MSEQELTLKDSRIYFLITEKAYREECEKYFTSEDSKEQPNNIKDSVTAQARFNLKYVVYNYGSIINVKQFVSKIIFEDSKPDIVNQDLDNDPKVKEDYDSSRSNIALLLGLDSSATWKEILDRDENFILIYLYINKIANNNLLTVEANLLRSLRYFVNKNILAILSDHDRNYSILEEIDKTFMDEYTKKQKASKLQ